MNANLLLIFVFNKYSTEIFNIFYQEYFMKENLITNEVNKARRYDAIQALFVQNATIN